MDWLLAWPKLFFVMVILNAFTIWWSCREPDVRNLLGKGYFRRPGIIIRRWRVGNLADNKWAIEIRLLGRPFVGGFRIYVHKGRFSMGRGDGMAISYRRDGARTYLKIGWLWVNWLNRLGRGDSILTVSFRGRKWERVFRYREKDRTLLY